MRKKSTMFTASRDTRNKACKEKDTVIMEILENIDIPNPAQFKALLMPSMYGPEAYYLIAKGVLPENIYAIEQDAPTHAEILHCERPDRKPLRGIQTTTRPMAAHRAIHRAKAHHGNYNLIYLDFFGQPEYNRHYKELIRPIFALGLLAKHATIVLNFGKTRSRSNTASMNNELRLIISNSHPKCLPTSIMIQAAIRETGHPYPSSISDTLYSSPMAGSTYIYTTTVATFSRNNPKTHGTRTEKNKKNGKKRPNTQTVILHPANKKTTRESSNLIQKATCTSPHKFAFIKTPKMPYKTGITKKIAKPCS